MPTFYVFRKVHYIMAAEFSTVYHKVFTSFKNETAQFKGMLKRCLQAHPIYCIDEFITYKNDSLHSILNLYFGF